MILVETDDDRFKLMLKTVIQSTNTQNTKTILWKTKFKKALIYPKIENINILTRFEYFYSNPTKNKWLRYLLCFL